MEKSAELFEHSMSHLLEEDVCQLMGSQVEEQSNGSLEVRDTRQEKTIGSAILVATAYCQVGSSNEGEEMMTRSLTVPGSPIEQRWKVRVEHNPSEQDILQWQLAFHHQMAKLQRWKEQLVPSPLPQSSA